MERNDGIRTVAELMDGAEFAMLTTLDGKQLVSRPMGVQQVEFDGDLWFFTFDSSNKVREIQSDPRCNVALYGKNSWISLSGTAELVRDRAKMDELWSTPLKAWFPDELETPGIVLLKVHADSAEYWDAPNSKMVLLFGMAKAAATGQQADPGDNKTVEL